MAAPDAATMRKLQAQGKAIANAKGAPSFQVRNRADLDHAIKAIGRVRPNTDEARARVRKYVMARAKALGLSSMIPGTWGSDGNLKDGTSDSDSGSSSKSGASSKTWDPDHDGDNDATPAGDTDHSHWSADGKQLKPVPGKPMSSKAVMAARIFAKKKAA
jgi:hypothetical protein